MSEPRNPCIYIWGGEGKYKIGFSYTPRQRVKSFPVMPFPCRFVLLLPAYTPNPLTTERYLRDYYKAKGRHLQGEWFSLTSEDIWELPSVAVSAHCAEGSTPAEEKVPCAVPLSVRQLRLISRHLSQAMRMGQGESIDPELEALWRVVELQRSIHTGEMKEYLR